MEKEIHILIVDDEVEIAVLLGFLLTMHNFKTDLAHNGKDALAKLRMYDYQYVISDVQMPGMNGAELFENVQKEFANPPKFLFISGFQKILSDEILEKTLGKLSKPVEHEKIVEIIKADVEKNNPS